MSDQLRADLDNLMQAARQDFARGNDFRDLCELAAVIDRVAASRAELAAVAETIRNMRQHRETPSAPQEHELSDDEKMRRLREALQRRGD